MSARPRGRPGWARLKRRLTEPDFAAGRVLAALDFDGTLAPIVSTPDKAALAPRTRSLLRRLAARPDTKVAVLSGRALGDLRRLVGLPGLFYAGNHGLEMKGPGLRWSYPGLNAFDERALAGLRRSFRDFPGTLVEHKGLGLAVHYRGLAPREVPRFLKRARAALRGLGGSYRILHGKKTLDLRPDFPWDKGRALQKIRRGLGGRWAAIFIGDDRTDEEGFRTLGNKAVTVRVGRGRRSSARYLLPGRPWVDRVLESLAKR